MRFVNSITVLSLVGLGLAAPGITDAVGAGGVPGSGALGLGLLGLRDEDEHGYKQKGHGRGVRRQVGPPAAPIPPNDDGELSATTLLRTRGDSEGDDGHGRGEHDSQSDGQNRGKPKPKPKGKGQGSGKEHDSSKGKTKSHKGQGPSKGDGKGKGKGKGKCNDARHTPCLHGDDVDTLVAAYTRMLSSWNDTDAKYLADNFVDYSDSINILAGIPLGSPSFPTKEAFIEHQHTQVSRGPASDVPSPVPPCSPSPP